jgi:translation initiation factor 1
MAKKGSFKNRQGVVYSTDPDFEYQDNAAEETDTPEPRLQQLKLSIEKKGRAGKTVTIVDGFVGRSEDLNELTKLLKSRCGTGGSAKDGQILIQGEVKEKVAQVLQKEGYKVRG